MARRPLAGKENVRFAGDNIPVEGVNPDVPLTASQHPLPHQLTGMERVQPGHLQLAVVDLLRQEANGIAVAIFGNVYANVNLLFHCLALSGLWGVLPLSFTIILIFLLLSTFLMC